MEPEDSLIIRDENLSTIPKKESDKVIKFSVKDLVQIPRGNFVIFSNHLFDPNDDFTSSDDESFPGEDEPEVMLIEAVLHADSFPPGIDGADFDPEGDSLVAYDKSDADFPFFYFCPKDKGIQGEIASDFEDSRARGFVHRSLELQSFACLYMGI
ncbi:hypothetical protein Tco_0415416 [Tanacetum coccineum]